MKRQHGRAIPSEPKGAEERAQWLRSQGERHPVLVAELEGKVVGWSSLSKWPDRHADDDTAETSFYVRSERRGRGIGRKLKEATIEEARRLQFRILIARVGEGNAEGLHLNESCGSLGRTLKELGRKFGRLLDVHVLQTMLNCIALDSVWRRSRIGRRGTNQMAGSQAVLDPVADQPRFCLADVAACGNRVDDPKQGGLMLGVESSVVYLSTSMSTDGRASMSYDLRARKSQRRDLEEPCVEFSVNRQPFNLRRRPAFWHSPRRSTPPRNSL